MLKHFVFGSIFTSLLMSSFLNVAESNIEKSQESFIGFLDSQHYFSNFTAEDRYQYRQAFESVIERHGFRGNVLIKKKGETIFRFSEGYRDYSNSIPLEEETIFELASVSKQFTAISILILHEEGLIDLDASITEYIPEFHHDRITIRQLLNHTSGISNYMWFMERQWNSPILPTNEDMVSILVRNRAGLNFTPGTRHAYSNTGYALLTSVVERVAEVPFSQFLTERIFIPAGLNNTFTYRCERRLVEENLAISFIPERRFYRPVTERPMDGILGDKGVFSTLSDLDRLDEVLYNGLLLSNESLEMAYAPTLLGRNQTQIKYGFGYRLDDLNGHQVIYHNGWWGGFRTSFKRYIDNHHTLVVLNNTNDNLGNFIKDLENIILKSEKETTFALK
ncbi:MAG: class A beta-lactamase-related serine hydrolase [Chitinophagaceae bacterium]|nr:MAG: class A beta-lactamase-related serine hydrolase [Chitinophagaceae bacterium]